MSRKHNYVADILREIEHCTAEEIEQLYGITFLEDGTIMDVVTDRIYNSVGEWAEETSYESYDDIIPDKYQSFDDDL